MIGLLFLLQIMGQHTNPNIVVIVADDLGVDRVEAYGEYPLASRTPNIDALAADGLLFRNAWVAPLCSPGRALFLTGQFGYQTGIGRNVQFPEDPQLVNETIFDIVGGAMFGKWHLGVGLDSPNEHGVSLFQGTIKQLFPGNYFEWDKVTNGKEAPVNNYATTETVDDALYWIGTQPPGWLCFVTLHSPHSPLHVPPQKLHSYGEPTTDQTVYRAMVEAMDTEVGRLVDNLPANTVVIFTADNGTPQHAMDDIPGVVVTHSKGTLFEGGINVPLIVNGPGVATGESGALVSLVDLFATILELQNVAGGTGDSLSLVPYFLEPEKESERTTVYAEQFVSIWFHHGQAIREERFKLHRIWREGEIRREKLFDLQEDSNEVDNLLNEELSPLAQRAYNLLESALPVP